jgi:hypothetical protein
VAEWSNALGCKPSALAATEVRILPGALAKIPEAFASVFSSRTPPGASRLLGSREDSKGAAMFRQQAKPRAGVAKNFCDDKSLFVTESSPAHKKIPGITRDFLLRFYLVAAQELARHLNALPPPRLAHIKGKFAVFVAHRHRSA